MPDSPEIPLGPDRRPAKLRILLPIALSVAALAVFLALFWHEGHKGARKAHGKRGPADRESGRSPVGGQDSELEDLGNTRVNKGGSPVGGGPSRPAGKGGKDEGGWWYDDGGKGAKQGEDGWWAPEK